MAVSFRRLCRCGHGKGAHEHYRSGSDCSSCGCLRFVGRVQVTLSLGRMRPGVVTPEAVPYPAGPYVRPTHSHGYGLPPVVVRQREAYDDAPVPESA